MGRLLILADLVLLVVALIDCLSSDEHEIRALPKVVWVFIILLFSPIGPIVWFVAGRPTRAMGIAAATGHPAGTGTVRRRREVAPDDDPEFLRELDARTRREEQDKLRRWEADLRRREDELRRRKAAGDGDATEG